MEQAAMPEGSDHHGRVRQSGEMLEGLRVAVIVVIVGEQDDMDIG